jgi:hypothetical protein
VKAPWFQLLENKSEKVEKGNGFEACFKMQLVALRGGRA